jgi:hypothetical protein
MKDLKKHSDADINILKKKTYRSPRQFGHEGCFGTMPLVFNENVRRSKNRCILSCLMKGLQMPVVIALPLLHSTHIEYRAQIFIHFMCMEKIRTRTG